ncbi:MAG: hypothetical protein EZS28_018529, partial [Streblomastix strix]
MSSNTIQNKEIQVHKILALEERVRA